MYDFSYVTRREAKSVRNERYQIIHEVQDIVRDDFTFQYRLAWQSYKVGIMKRSHCVLLLYYRIFPAVTRIYPSNFHSVWRMRYSMFLGIG